VGNEGLCNQTRHANGIAGVGNAVCAPDLANTGQFDEFDGVTSKQRVCNGHID
jgi:hypothetical protein